MKKFWTKKEEKPRKNLDDFIVSKDDESSEVPNIEYNNDMRQKEEEKKENTTKGAISFTALDCFGLEEKKTDKWMIRCTNVWFGIMSLMWFLFGALTFAPVIFISNKVNVIFKHKVKSMVCAILIYAFVIVAFILLTRTRGTVETPVVS